MKKIISIFIALIIVLSSFSMISFAVGQEETKSVEYPTFGAIRWDAWYGHSDISWAVVSQVEKTLSPKEFHFRAPFFAEITQDNKIIIPEYTQEIFDREMEYAKYAGIDYFAYNWYQDYETDVTQNGLQNARKFHQTSKYRNDVKMCIIDPVVNDEAIAEMSTLLTSDYYMTVLDGRPLMYYILSGNMESITERINIFKNLAQSLGVPEPYAVIMNPSASEAKRGGASAVSKYAIDGSQLSFDELTKVAENVWNEKYTQCKSYFTQFQFVPTVTYGWHTKPRYINPVTWMTVGENYWCDYATDIELLNHLAYAMSYVQHPSVKPYCEANTVIAYAWNEHDEGGWICPTLEVDENGNQLYNADGTKKINERRINATKAAIDFIRSGNVVKVTVNGVSNNSTISKASDAIANVNDIINDKVFNGIGKMLGATLSLGTSLTMNYYATNMVDSSDLQMRFTTPNDYQVLVDGVYDNEIGRIRFDYTGINPQCMTDEITAELLYKGRTIETIRNYSVKQYCQNIYAKSGNALRQLMADMLVYGKEAQLYKDYNTSNLADNLSWVSTYKSTFAVPEGVRIITGNADVNNRVTAASLNMSNVNKIYFRMVLTDDVTIKLNGNVVDKSVLKKESGNQYLLYTKDIFAYEFDKVYTLELIKDGVVITSVDYNVNGYIASKYSSASNGELVKALNQYGLSTKIYYNLINNDGDIDFDDSEDFETVPDNDGDITFGDNEEFETIIKDADITFGDKEIL